MDKEHGHRKPSDSLTWYNRWYPTPPHNCINYEDYESTTMFFSIVISLYLKHFENT